MSSWRSLYYVHGIQSNLVKYSWYGCFRSRFSSEFVEIGRIGAGGFGSVVRARHKLDGTEYAVKRVRIKRKKVALVTKVLREVTSLALLDHPNIVSHVHHNFMVTSITKN